MPNKIDDEKLAAQFIAYGYRRISNKYRTVSRIDRPDWLEFMEKKMFREPGSMKQGEGWEDYYRRVYSRDKVDGLPDAVYRLIPGSDHDSCGYMEFKDA